MEMQTHIKFKIELHRFDICYRTIVYLSIRGVVPRKCTCVCNDNNEGTLGFTISYIDRVVIWPNEPSFKKKIL